MSTFTLIFVKVILLFAVLCYAQQHPLTPSGKHWWNGFYNNYTIPSPPGWVYSLDSATLYYDGWDYTFNASSKPAIVNATLHATNLVTQSFYTFNITLKGLLQGAVGGQFLWVFALLSDNLSPCYQTDNSVPYCGAMGGNWAQKHWTTNTMLACCDYVYRCNQLALQWPLLGGTSVSMVRGDALGTGSVFVAQGNNGPSATLFQATANFLYALKITANSTGQLSEFCGRFLGTQTTLGAYIYTDNAGTLAGGSLLWGGTTISPAPMFSPGNSGQADYTNQYYTQCFDNNIYRSLTITSGQSYWLGVSSAVGIWFFPYVAGGAPAASSFISIAAIGNLDPPLIGPAGTTSNNYYHWWIVTK